MATGRRLRGTLHPPQTRVAPAIRGARPRTEKALIKAVHKKLGVGNHHQSMTGATLATNGTPDQYYDLPVVGEIWVEYKMLKSMPRSRIALGAYTPLQLSWLERRYKNSTRLAHTPNVLGVVGLPNGTVAVQRTPTEWREGTSITLAITIEEFAKCLCDGSVLPELSAG